MPSFQKYSFRNPNGTYRVPLKNGVGCEIDTLDTIPCLLGKIANRIGEYEAIGTPEEFAKLKGIEYSSIKVRSSVTQL